MTYIHPTAEVHPDAQVDDGVSVWNWTKVREGARIRAGTTIGQGVYIDHDVEIGRGCKIQNGVSLYHPATLGDHVFVGPNATFTNDLVPRAANEDWNPVPTRLDDHASVGANATIVCGVTLGRACMVGAGAVVTRDVPPFALVVGNPARILDWVDLDGNRLHRDPDDPPDER